jgi:hypothetical protein
MRDDEGRADGKRVGEALGYFSDPAEREGKTFVFPHIFAEIMQLYMRLVCHRGRSCRRSPCRSTPTRGTIRTRRCKSS